jgi:hypothetical protein
MSHDYVLRASQRNSYLRHFRIIYTKKRVGSRFCLTVNTGSGAHPASCIISIVSFSGVKRPERGVNHPSPFSAEVKERVALQFYSRFCTTERGSCYKERFQNNVGFFKVLYHDNRLASRSIWLRTPVVYKFYTEYLSVHPQILEVCTNRSLHYTRNSGAAETKINVLRFNRS